MSLKKFVVISEMSGVYKLLGNRGNGLIVEDFDSGKRKFISARKHQFTPLDSIAIYTTGGDTIPLFEVFQSMQEKQGDVPLPPYKNLDSDAAFGYMEAILPNYDRDQVFLSDVRKLVKWFGFLNERDLLDFSPEAEEGNTAEESQDVAS